MALDKKFFNALIAFIACLVALVPEWTREITGLYVYFFFDPQTDKELGLQILMWNSTTGVVIWCVVGAWAVATYWEAKLEKLKSERN